MTRGSLHLQQASERELWGLGVGSSQPYCGWVGWEVACRVEVLRECREAAVAGFYYQLRQNGVAREEEEGAGLAELEARAMACLCDARRPEDRKA